MIFCRSKILRHEDDRLDASAGSGRGDSIGEVAGGGAGEHLQPQLAGGGEGDCDDPVLEGMGRVPGVVLDPELLQTEIVGEVAGVDQPGETGIGGTEGGDVGWDRQQRGISPDAPRARLDLLAGDGRERIADLERTEALHTGVERAERRARSPQARQTRWVAFPKAPARTPGGAGSVSTTAVMISPSSSFSVGFRPSRSWHRF